MCLRLVALAALLQLTLAQEALPSSPCPDLYAYERDPSSSEWRGIISLLTPARYSEVKLEVTLSSSVPVSQEEVGDVAVRGGQQGAMEATRAVLANRRHILQYVVMFPFGKPVPSLVKVIVNEKEFCNAGRVPSNSRSQITLHSFLSTGVNVPQSNGQGFDLVNKSPTRPSQPSQEASTTQPPQPWSVVGGAQSQPSEEEDLLLSRTIVKLLRVLLEVETQRLDLQREIAYLKRRQQGIRE